MCDDREDKQRISDEEVEVELTTTIRLKAQSIEEIKLHFNPPTFVLIQKQYSQVERAL